MTILQKATALAITIFGVALVASVPVGAQISQGAQDARGDGTASSIDLTGSDSIVTKIVNYILWFVGVLSVVMLIWGGIRYATSAGDSGKVTAAKNTILYAIIGLVVALFSYAIVMFVNGAFGS